MPNKTNTIEQERAAFDAMLDRLLEAHAGKWVLFHSGEVVGYFESMGEAYAAGVEHFGADEVFLVTQVKAPSPESISIAWDAGVMFG